MSNFEALGRHFQIPFLKEYMNSVGRWPHGPSFSVLTIAFSQGLGNWSFWWGSFLSATVVIGLFTIPQIIFPWRLTRFEWISPPELVLVVRLALSGKYEESRTKPWLSTLYTLSVWSTWSQDEVSIIQGPWVTVVTRVLQPNHTWKKPVWEINLRHNWNSKSVVTTASLILAWLIQFCAFVCVTTRSKITQYQLTFGRHIDYYQL